MKKKLFILTVLLLSLVGLRAQTSCTAPTGLTGKVHTPEWRNAQLEWSALTYTGETVFGYTQNHPMIYKNGNDFTAVIRIPVSELAALSGKSLTGIRFRPYLLAPCEYYIKVWQGGTVDTLTNAINPGTLLLNQHIDNVLTMRSDNNVLLSTPVTVNPNQEMWIGLRMVYNYNDGFPMMYDDAVCVNGASNLVNTPSGWELTTNRAWFLSGIFANTADLVSYNVYRDNVLLANTSTNVFKDSLVNDGTYNYEVKALYVSGCESSPASTTVVMNDNDMITTLPYTENFDGITGSTAATLAGHVMPSGWNFANFGSSNVGLPSVYSTSSYAASTPNSLRFQMTTATTYSDQYAILPPLDVNAHPINTLQLEFDARSYSSGSTSYPMEMVVGVMSSISDVSTFVPVDTMRANSPIHSNFVVNFSQYTGNGRYIALKAPHTNSSGAAQANYAYLDNLILDVIPLCPKPQGLVENTNATTQTSLELSWQEMGTATEWLVEYGPAGFTPGNGTMVTATATTMTVSNLSPSTTYDFYVRSLCSGGDTSAYSNNLTCHTVCGPITSLPYEENFDSYIGATSVSATAVLPNCWNNQTTGNYNNYAGYPFMYNYSTHSLSGNNSLYFSSYKTSATMYGGDEYVILPPIDTVLHPMNTLQLEFSARKRAVNTSNQTSSYYQFILYVGVWANDSTFTPVDTIEIGSLEDIDYRSYIIPFNNFVGPGNRIALMAPAPLQTSVTGSSYGTYYYNAGHVDDIMVSVIPSCPKPFAVEAYNALPYSVTADWTPMGSETNWEVVVVPAGTDPDNGVAMPTTEHPFTYTGLTPATDYELYVRADCGGGDYSPWSKEQEFTTKCAPTTIPYVENFDSYGASTSTSTTTPGPFPTCWTALNTNTTPYPYINSNYRSSGVGGLYFYSTTAAYSYAASQPIDVSQYAAGSLALQFNIMKTSANYGRLTVGVTTNPNYIDSIVVLKEYYPTDYENINTWYPQLLVVPGHYDAPLYIVFYLPEGGTRYAIVDDVLLDVAPDCPEASLLAVDNVTGSSALLTWTAAPCGATGYSVEYSELGQNSWSAPITVTDNHCLLSGLNPETQYEVRLYTECATGASTALTASFRTGCLSGLSDVTVGTGTSTTNYVPTYATTGTTAKYSLTQELWLASELGGVAGDINAISLKYAGTMDTSRIYNIYMMHTVESNIPNTFMSMTGAQLVYSGNVRWEMGGDGWNTILLDTVFHFNGSENLVVTFDDNTGTVVGSTTAMKFYYTANGSTTASQNNCHVVYKYQANDLDPFNPAVTGTRSTYRNNIRFGFACSSTVTCVAPNVIVTDVASDNITLDWVAGYTENAWEVQFKTAGDPDFTSEGLVTLAPHTIYNLQANQDYTIRMRSVCAPDDSSDWVTVLASTPCVDASFPLTENFDSYTPATSGSAGVMPTCWGRLTNYETNRPYISSAEAFSGTGSLRLYGTTSYYGIAVLPRFDASIPMDSLQVQFRALSANAGGYVQVGVMTDPTDISTFVATGSFTPTEINVWEYAAINTVNYTGNGRYLAFRVPQDMTTTFYVDDVNVDYKPNCVAVTNIQSSNVTATEADITWDAGGSESTWNYFYGPSDAVDMTMTYLSAITNTNSLHLTGLTPNTNYTVFVQSYCDDGETGAWMLYDFNTQCLPMQIPYYETFENYAGVTSYTDEVLPDCWHRINTGSYSYYLGMPVIYGNGTYAQEGNNSLYFYSSQSLSTDYGNLYAILPEVDADVTPVNTLQISFGIRKYLASYDANLVVGVMSDVNNIATFVPMDTVQAANTTYSDVTVSLANYTGTGRYITLFLDKNLSTTTTCGAYVDNIMVETLPQCDAPTNLVVSNVSQTSATLSWTAGGNETSWEVTVVPHGDEISSVTPMTVNANPTTLTGLTDGTVYDVYVRAICPGNTGYSSYVFESFTTNCYPLAQLPFSENFDSENGISTATSTTNNLPVCWHYINTGTNTYSGCPYVYNSSSYAASGTNSLRFYSGTASAYAPQYAILPQIDVQQNPINTLQLELDMRKYSTSYTHFSIVVGVMTDPANDSTFVPVDTLYANSTGYENHFVYFNNYQGTGSYIALLASNQAGVNINGGYVDNIVLSVMSNCLRVQNDLAASHITTDAITLSWTPTGTESAWVVEYREESDSVWAEHNTSFIPTTITGLTPNTTYVFQVKADCGSGSFSEPSNPLSVITDCLPMGIPFTENFDTYTDAPASATSNYLPSCWRHINTGSMSTYPGCPTMYSGSSYANSGTISLKFFTGTASSYAPQYAIMPAIDTTQYPMQNLKLKLSAKKSSTSYSVFRLEVGVMTDPYDAITFTPHDTLDFTSDSYTEKSVYFSNFAGIGNRIALRAVKDAGVAVNQGYVDDIEISMSSNCLPVRDNVTVSNVTANSADLSWTPNGTETEWLLRYKTNQAGVPFDTVVVTGTPAYQLQNLMPNTTYAWQVLASCGNGEYSATWTPIALFTTNCSDITTLPYNETFESTAGTTSSSDHTMPDCWNYYNTGTSYTGLPQVYSSTTYAQNSTNSLKFYTYTTTAYSDQYAILPGIDPTLYPMNTLQISMGARRSSSSYNLMLIVGVMTDPSNISTFEPVDTISPVGTTYSNHTVRFDHYTGTGKYIALKAPKISGTNYNEGYVDNIVVDVAPFICNAPTNVTASNIQQTSATITWTAANGESDWVLQYREPSGSWSSDINVTGTPSYNLTGLSAGTQYEVHVKAVCDNTHSSDWSATATFTTQSSVTPPTVTTEAADNIGEMTATLHGTVTAGSETITAQGFEWKATAGGSYTAVNATGTAMSYDLTGLTAGTGYTFRAFATTASGTTYGNELTFTTQSHPQDTCAVPTNVTASDITENSVVIFWTQQGDVTNWDVDYRVAGTSSWYTVTTTTNPHTLTGLTPETSYEVQVIAHCTNGETSDPSATITFTTNPDGIESHELNNVVVYPNPTNGVVQIKNGEWRMENVEVYDAYGKLLNTMSVNDHTVNLDLSGYAKGTYFVRVTTERGVVTKRVVKN